MIKQFVEHFNTRDYGFNFFPALGWIFGALAGQAFSLVIFAVLNALREHRTISLNAAPSLFYAVLASSLFIFLCHAVRDDTLFPVVFSLSYVLVGIVARWITYVTASMGVYIFSVTTLTKYLFDPLTLAGGFFWALALSLTVMLLHMVFKRMDYALLIGFPAAEFISDLFYPVVALVRGEKFSLQVEFLMVNLAEAFLIGFFVYLGYTLFLRARGLRLSGQRIESLNEETAPRTRLLPVKMYFGLMLAVFLLNLVLLGFIVHLWNWRHADSYALSQMTRMPPNLEAGGLVIIVLSAMIAAVALAVSVLMIYKMWTAVQDGKASTTPGLAVGLLFVPVFNLYWGFQVFYGFARDYNALVKRQGLKVPPLPSWLYLTQVILALAAGASSILAPANISVPVVAAFLLLSLSLATVFLTCQAVNRIPAEFYRRA